MRGAALMSPTHVRHEDRARAEAEYRRLLDRSPAPVCVHDGQVVVYINPAAIRVLGAASDTQIVQRPIADFIDPASWAGVRTRLADLRGDGDVTDPAEVTLRRVDGTTMDACSVAAMRISDGRPMYEVIFDRIPLAAPVIDDHRGSAPQTAERRLRAVLDLLHDGVVIMGTDGRFEFTNAAARRILGSNADDLVGVHHSTSGLDLPLFDAQGQQLSFDAHPIRWIQRTGLSLGGDIVGVDRLDGKRVWITGRGCLIDPSDPHNSSVLFSFTDITEHHDARERLRHDATHDWLTGLPNRVHALNQAATSLVTTGDDRLSAVLFIDLDRLKSVNDSHGHPVGDGVLRVAAQRMQSVMRPPDLVARIGGDEFVVLMMGPTSSAEVEALAGRVHTVLSADIAIETLTLQIGASIGITTVTGTDRRSLAEVLRDADTAMYRAKARGPANTSYFEREPRGAAATDPND
ncbi:putative signaling protein [Mycolicibacterium vanbaalenii]|uniref:Putative signaling protein n=2 Tax=Mycolicibacterium vanbaalenii TaxID=110539 RepID=A0A5S9NV86_MYCVN|nr:putative signaling protein [Mycolicibacterium vanbaalenii]